MTFKGSFQKFIRVLTKIGEILEHLKWILTTGGIILSITHGYTCKHLSDIEVAKKATSDSLKQIKQRCIPIIK